jgi:hypothetical protein
MNIKLKSFLLWVLSFLMMAGASIYQRMTGPTHPMRGSVELSQEVISYRLIRTWGDDSGALIKIKVPSESTMGECYYKRYKSFDSWDTIQMIRDGEYLTTVLPQLPPAGKVMYHIALFDRDKQVILNEEPAVLRYKGSVPAFVLIPHIIFMFLAMMFSMRTGFEALFVRKNTFKLAWLTLAFLIVGGLILGPIVQKYAFDAYWTGWPFGTDLTDNKTAIAFVFWVVAVLVLRKKKNNRLWPVLAALVLLMVYMIPHSLMGSEIDYTKEETAKTEVNND